MTINPEQTDKEFDVFSQPPFDLESMNYEIYGMYDDYNDNITECSEYSNNKLATQQVSCDCSYCCTPTTEQNQDHYPLSCKQEKENVNKSNNIPEEQSPTDWYRNINNNASNIIPPPFFNNISSVIHPSNSNTSTVITTVINTAHNNDNDKNNVHSNTEYYQNKMNNLHKMTQRNTLALIGNKLSEKKETTKRTTATSKSQEKRYKCCECKKTFKRKNNLKIHLKIHSEKALKCKYCNKKFVRKTNLKQHERVHTGERPFECIICKAKFKQQHSLKHHFAAHAQTNM